MGNQNRIYLIRKFAEILLIGSILFLSSISLVMGNIRDNEASNGTVAIFYGSSNDRDLGQEIVDRTDIVADYYNISEVQMNSSFVFNNETVVSLWWINELALTIDLTFLGDINRWIQAEKGLFVMNRDFRETPLQYLSHFGIAAYAPLLYPFNESYQMQEVDLIDFENVPVNITQTSYQVNCSSGWVDIDNTSQMIVELETPQEDTWLSGLKSGIWMRGTRFIVGSISISLDEVNPSSRFHLQGMKSPQAEDFIELLGELALLTSGSVSSGGIFSLQFGEMEQIMSLGILLITIITSLIILLKIGLFSRIRDAILPLTASLFLFIAHIAYSPQKRRINESQLLENELRVQIVDFLEQKGEQGAHLREIQRKVGCGISSLLWHLQALDDFNLITNEKIGKYHIFYLTGIKSVQTTEITLALKSDVAKGLCRLLIKQRKPVSLSKISQEIEVHHSSAQHHIKRLAELGVILILKEKKRSQYIISPKKIPSLKNLLEVA